MRIAGAGARSAAPPSASLPPSPPPSSSDEPRVAGSSPGSPPAGGAPGDGPRAPPARSARRTARARRSKTARERPGLPPSRPSFCEATQIPGGRFSNLAAHVGSSPTAAVGEPRHTRRGAPPEARCSEAPRWVGRWYRSRRAAPQRISRERGAARPRPHPRSPARRRTTARDTTRLGRSNRVIPRLARRTARRGDGRRRPPSSRDRPRPTPRPRPRSRAIA